MPIIEAGPRPDVESTPPQTKPKKAPQDTSKPTSPGPTIPEGDQFPLEFLRKKSWGEKLNESWKNLINKIPGLKKTEVKKAVSEIQEKNQESGQEKIDVKYVAKKILEIRQREEERLEARHGKGLIGKARGWLNETGIGRSVKILGKLLVASVAVAAPTVLTGGVGVIAAPILYSLGLKESIDSVVEAIQFIGLGGNKRRLKAENARERLIRRSKYSLEDLIFQKDLGKVTDEEFAKELTYIEKEIADAEENVINLENDNVTLESKQKMIRGLISTITSVPLAILTGIPLGVQKFDPKSVGHLVQLTTNGFEFIYNIGEKWATAHGLSIYGVTHALSSPLAQGASEAAKAAAAAASIAARKGLENIAIGLGTAILGLVAKTCEEVLQYTKRKKIDKETLSKIKVEDSEPEKPKNKLSQEEKDDLDKRWQEHSDKIREIFNRFDELKKDFLDKTGINYFLYDQLHDKDEKSKVDSMDEKYKEDFKTLKDTSRFISDMYVKFSSPTNPTSYREIQKALENQGFLGEIDHYHKKLTEQKETERPSKNPKEAKESDEKKIRDLHEKIMDIVSFHEELTGKIQDKKIDPNRVVGISIREIEQLVGGALEAIDEKIGHSFDSYNPKPGELETILKDEMLLGRINSVQASIEENKNEIFEEEPKPEPEPAEQKEARPATPEDFKVTEGVKKTIGEKKLDTEPKLTQEEIDKLLAQYSIDGSETPQALQEKIQAGILESGTKLSETEINALLETVDAKQKQPTTKKEQSESENQAKKHEKEVQESWTKCLKKEKEIGEISLALRKQLYDKYGLEPVLRSLIDFQNMEESDKLVADTILQMAKFQKHLFDTYGKDKSTFEDKERNFNGHDDLKKLDRMHELFTSGKLVVEPKTEAKEKSETSREKTEQTLQPEQEKPTIAGIKNVLDFLRLGIKHSAKKTKKMEEQGIKENDPDYIKYKSIQDRLNKILSENDLLDRKDTKENINALLEDKPLVNRLVKLYNELNATPES